MNFDSENLFVNATFSSRRGGKFRLKCVLLGVGVAIAEAVRMKLTAGNLDKVFDSKCGSFEEGPTT